MIHCLIRYLSGYVKIQIKGYSPERFLNLCCYHRIRFWGLTRIGTNYELYLSLSDFRKIRPYVRKTHTKVILKKRYGFPFFLYRYRKRKLFFISILLCIFLIDCYSQFLWDIHFQGNDLDNVSERRGDLSWNAKEKCRLSGDCQSPSKGI